MAKKTKRGRRPTVADEELEEESALAGEGFAEEFIGEISMQEFDAMPQPDREEYIDLLRAHGYDPSLYEVRGNEIARKGWSKIAELQRMEPEEDEDGRRIRGLIRRFSDPDELQIRQYAMNYCGGGQYQIMYYDDRRRMREKVVFEVAGDPKSSRDQERAKREAEREEAHKPAPTLAGADPEKQFLKAELDRMREEATTRRIDKLEDLLTRLAERPAPAPEPKANTADLVTAFGTALATAAPLLKLFVGDKNSGVDQMKMMVEMVEKTAKENRESLEKLAKNLKSDDGGPMAAATTKMLDLAIAKAMGAGQQDPQAIVMDIMKKMVPNLVDRSLEIAQLKAENEGSQDKSMGERILDQVGDLVGPLVANATRQGGQAAMAAAPTMPMQPTPTAPFAPGAMPAIRTGAPMMSPQANPNGPVVGAPQPGVWPYSQAMPGQPAPPQAPAPVVQAPAPAPVSHAPAGDPAGGPQAPVAPPNTAAHVQPAFYDLVIGYLQRNLSGDELAEYVDEQVEKVQKGEDPGPPILSEWAIEKLETVHPRLAVHLALQYAAPEKLAQFVDPNTNDIHIQVMAFLDDFARHFFDSDNGDGDGDGGDGTPAPTVSAPDASVPASEPVPEPAVDVEAAPTPEGATT